MWLLLLFIAVPAIEIALFIEVGGWIGTWPTVALVLLTALIGAGLVRAQGLAVLARLQREMRSGLVPAAALAEGAMLLVAGLLLLTPGFFTDTVGFLLLLPPLRHRVAAALAARVVVHTPPPRGAPGTVDGEWRDVTAEPARLPPRPGDDTR